MNQTLNLNEFINCYPVQKTLKFELIPQGRTLEHIQKDNLLRHDEHRAESYIEAKRIIDDYHKNFIEKSLSQCVLKYDNENGSDSLKEYLMYHCLPQKDEKDKKAYENIQKNLRKQITKTFADNNVKQLFEKDLIKKLLPEFVESPEDKKIIAEFSDFTTYFTGFHENRKNMYSDEPKATAIAYRLINENLPKYIDNISVFAKIKETKIAEDFKTISEELRECLKAYPGIDHVFRLESYSKTLTQSMIDNYNTIIGGLSTENGVKIKGINEYINLYNQRQSDKNARMPRLKPLFKQILSDRNAASFLPQAFKSDSEVLESIEKCYHDINERSLNRNVPGAHSLKSLLLDIDNFDLDKIYLKNDLSLTDISKKCFGDWSVINKAIEARFEQDSPRKAKETGEKYEERKSKYVKSFDSVSISFLSQCLKLLDNSYDSKIEDYFKSLGKTASSDNLFSRISNNYNAIRPLLISEYPENKKLSQDKENVEIIKLFLDDFKELQRFVKPLLGKGDEPEKDQRFHSELAELWSVLDQITPLYNKVRNHMTQKPYSEEKIKLTFENSTLLNGWDLNKEPDNTAIMFRKNDLYYLGIMNKKHNRSFKPDKLPCDGECFEKMEYKLLPGPNKMLPKVFFSDSRINEFMPDEILLQNYQKGTHKKGDQFNINHCHALIDFFKNSINKHEDWSKFEFNFSKTSEYEDISGFYREVEQQGYKLSFKKISADYISSLVDQGKLYLFQIYNKDFSPHSKGTPNMHTLYWKMLFSPENLRDVVYKLNGEAEVFHRQSSIRDEDNTVHKAGVPIDNKNPLNSKKQSTFKYDITKNRRYTSNKFMFHVPITINFKAGGNGNINPEVNQYVRNSQDIHVIGIDRGERHLLYLTLIDPQGRIKQQFSLNEIINEYKDKTYRTDYRRLLDEREEQRDKARKSWQTIENIKDLKEGYLSQVIHKIATMMIEHNAIVALEDLNMGFMRGRQKVEKQVYQKFEKMLIDKLNLLVNKNTDADKTGGALKAYQLTNKFESFQKLGKQSGLLFYVPAWNTSKIDPATGFVNLFDTRYENIDKTRAFIDKFDRICFNSGKNYFEFSFDYSKFTAKAEGTRTKWTVCTHGRRIETFRNKEKNSQWDSREIFPSSEFMELFKSHNIDCHADNLKPGILAQSEKTFFEKFLKLLSLTLQMRNSISGTDTDFLLSPVPDSNGNFFSSDNADPSMPRNADANGAFNIARKGLWIIHQIRSSDDNKKIKLTLSNKEWLQFAQTLNH